MNSSALKAIIARQVAHMSSLLDDLLDVSRITRASFVSKRSTRIFRSLMDDAVEASAGRSTPNGTLFASTLPNSPIILEVDPVRITQVITNLLTNAVKYTSAVA